MRLKLAKLQKLDKKKLKKLRQKVGIDTKMLIEYCTIRSYFFYLKLLKPSLLVNNTTNF